MFNLEFMLQKYFGNKIQGPLTEFSIRTIKQLKSQAREVSRKYIFN